VATIQVHLSKEAKRETTAVLLYLHNLLLWVMVDKAYTTTGVTAVTTHNTHIVYEYYSLETIRLKHV